MKFEVSMGNEEAHLSDRYLSSRWVEVKEAGWGAIWRVWLVKADSLSHQVVHYLVHKISPSIPFPNLILGNLMSIYVLLTMEAE
jgi:hypothetical protein